MRHDFDVTSLLLGLVFAAAAVAGLNGWFRDAVATPDMWGPEMVVATVLVALGLLLGGIVAALLGRRRRREQTRAAAADGVAAGADRDRPDPDSGDDSGDVQDTAGDRTHADA